MTTETDASKVAIDELGESECETIVIADMKARAYVYGLWTEVKDAYDGYRKNGDSPAEAARCALYDWDL